MNIVPSRIHGYGASQFVDMLRSELRLDLGDSIRILGGMSNLNLLITDRKKQYVVKIPALQLEYQKNPYDMQWTIHGIAYRHSLSTRPVAKGTLGNGLPYLVTEYEQGITKTNPQSFQEDELALIRDAQRKFSHIEIPIPCYDHPIAYLSMKKNQLEQVSNNDESHSSPLCDFLEKMRDLGTKLEEKMIELPRWPSDTVHGDLRPSNVILKENSIVFVDFEETFRGSSFYDYAYFFAEPKGRYEVTVDSPLVRTRENLEAILNLVPLALFSCLIWTFTRLVHIEMRIVEENLVNPSVRTELIKYFRQKSVQLADTLEVVT